MTITALAAHAAFFVEDAPTPRLSTLFTPGPMLAILAGVVGALVVWALLSACADPRRGSCAVRWLSELASDWLGALTEWVPPIARVALGGALVWCALTGAVATPSLHLEAAIGTAACVATLVLGGMLILGAWPRAAAFASICAFAIAAVAAGHPVVVLERADIVGMALFVMIVGGRRLEPRIDEATLLRIGRASTWLRVLVAAALVTVAINEKLANVPMTAGLLEAHPRVNVGLLLGLDAHATVLLLGSVEIAFAVLVLLLPLPEIAALAVGAPFVLTVGEFGLPEIPGHLPVWGAVVVLALLGAHPQTSDLVSIRPPWMRHRRRTPDAARVRVVGGRVPWVEREPAVAVATASLDVTAPTRIAVGGTVTPLPIPSPPPLAPQVAAWLRGPAEQVPSLASRSRLQAADGLDRFQWRPLPEELQARLRAASQQHHPA